MTEERIREIAAGLAAEAHCRYCDYNQQDVRLKCKADVENMALEIADAIRLALAERDREIAEWAKEHADVIPAEDSLERGVELGPLLKFLEAGG